MYQSFSKVNAEFILNMAVSLKDAYFIWRNLMILIVMRDIPNRKPKLLLFMIMIVYINLFD